jgi:hypothetical protein
MKMKVVGALLWMIRAFNFGLVLDDGCVSVYAWERSFATGVVYDWFESPNGSGVLERYSVTYVLENDGFLWLVWQILMNSSLLWRKPGAVDLLSDEPTFCLSTDRLASGEQYQEHKSLKHQS